MPTSSSNFGSSEGTPAYRLEAVSSVVEQQEDNNRSRVRIVARMVANRSTSVWNNDTTSGWTRYDNANQASMSLSSYGNSGSTVSSGTTYTITTRERWIDHNSSGSKTVGIRAYHDAANPGFATTADTSHNYSLPSLYQGISVSSFSIDNITTESVRLNVSCNRTANLLQWSIDGGAWQSASKTFSSTTQTISGLTPGTSYGFRVRVRRSSNNNYSSASSTLNRTTNAVTLDTVNELSATDVNFSFNVVAAYLCDRLQYRLDGGSWQTISGDFTDDNFTIGENLRSGRTYTIEFRARHKDSQTNTPIVSREVTTKRQNNFFGIVTKR